MTNFRGPVRSPMTASTGYHVVPFGHVAARIVCGNETVDVVRSRVAAEYHVRQLISGAEYFDTHRPIGARIQPAMPVKAALR